MKCLPCGQMSFGLLLTVKYLQEFILITNSLVLRQCSNNNITLREQEFVGKLNFSVIIRVCNIAKLQL